MDSISDFSTAKTIIIYGISLPVVDKHELIEYKKIVARDTDLIDVEFMTTPAHPRCLNEVTPLQLAYVKKVRREPPV